MRRRTVRINCEPLIWLTISLLLLKTINLINVPYYVVFLPIYAPVGAIVILGLTVFFTNLFSNNAK